MAEGDEIQVASTVREDARRVIRDSQTTADRLMRGSRELEHMVYGVSSDGSSLNSTEQDILEARMSLEQHQLHSASRSVRRAEKALILLENDVIELRRNIAMLNRLLNEKTLTEAELETILRRLKNATGAAGEGDVGYAAEEVEQLIGELVVDSKVALNPFLFRNFWMGVDTRWPLNGEAGVMIVNIRNDGTRPIPEMRLVPPVPEGWTCKPKSFDWPVMRPGDNLSIRFEIKPGSGIPLDLTPLARKLTIQTGYEVRAGQIRLTMRVQNRSGSTLRDILLQPWMPPGYKSHNLPLVEKLSSEEIGVVSMPLVIDMGDGGETAA